MYIFCSRIKGSSRQSVIFRIETEGGKHTEVQKKVEKEVRDTKTNMQLNNISKMIRPNNVDDVAATLMRVSDDDIMEFEEDGNHSTDFMDSPTESREIDTNYADSYTDSEEDSLRQMIVLFDNSYSWYRAKELK